MHVCYIYIMSEQCYSLIITATIPCMAQLSVIFFFYHLWLSLMLITHYTVQMQ